MVKNGNDFTIFELKTGTRERNRTSDQKFRKLLLYPLSYPGDSFNVNTINIARFAKKSSHYVKKHEKSRGFFVHGFRFGLFQSDYLKFTVGKYWAVSSLYATLALSFAL